MGVLKYTSVRYDGGGVDIQNTVNIPMAVKEQEVPEDEQNRSAQEQEQEKSAPEPRFSVEEMLAQRETEILIKERELEKLRDELSELKDQYIEQGKQVIIEAKRRADGILANAETQADDIRADAEKNREDVYIKARAEGFEQGKKDGVAACMAAGQGILDEAREYSERINEEKTELFARYEKEIYETVMEIANKVTLNSMAVKDGTAAKKLIKKAAKDFRNSQLIRVTLDENGASTELAGDYEYLKEICMCEHVEVELIADAAPGTVIVDNGEEITDAGIQTQLKMIKELGDGKFRTPAPKKRRKKAAPKTEAEETSKAERRDASEPQSEWQSADVSEAFSIGSEDGNA